MGLVVVQELTVACKWKVQAGVLLRIGSAVVLFCSGEILSYLVWLGKKSKNRSLALRKQNKTL